MDLKAHKGPPVSKVLGVQLAPTEKTAIRAWMETMGSRDLTAPLAPPDRKVRRVLKADLVLRDREAKMARMERMDHLVRTGLRVSEIHRICKLVLLTFEQQLLGLRPSTSATLARWEE